MNAQCAGIGYLSERRWTEFKPYRRHLPSIPERDPEPAQRDAMFWCRGHVMPGIIDTKNAGFKDAAMDEAVRWLPIPAAVVAEAEATAQL